MTDFTSLSLWHDSLGADEWAPRFPLAGDTSADIAIVGGGLTGLWTAYYLQRSDPTLRIVVLEAQVVGFGASGRNGGWCSALLPMSIEAMTKTHSHEQAMAMQREMFTTVDEVGAVAAAEGIDCDFQKGGTVGLARTALQVARGRSQIAEMQHHGFSDDDYRWMDADEAAGRVGASNVLGATFTPHCAAIHPSKLVRGLARVLELRGVRIYEQTPVTRINPGSVETAQGKVRAEVIVRATEAFSPALPGLRRSVAPVYSLMIATEPLDDSFFDTVGLHHRETFNDGRRMVIYGQRTADNRLAFGGRGAPYHFASKIKPEFDQHPRVHQLIHNTLKELFPSLGDAAVTHRWGGAVAVPRDWWCSARFDRATGIASAGGYVGDGVGTTNLAGRTLTDLILRVDSDLVRLPWVDHRSRQWEPEPLRWLGINGMVTLPSGADRYEEKTGKPERWRSAILSKTIGH